jgi:hypothetical protein
MEVVKHQSFSNHTMRCEFGFWTTVGLMPIAERTSLANVLSSASQYVNTVLPIDPDSDTENEITVYAKCYDSTGRKKERFYPVVLSDRV